MLPFLFVYFTYLISVYEDIQDIKSNNLFEVVCSFRNYLKSKWGMEVFMIADAEAVNGRKNFIIIVLKDKLKVKDLPRELRTYMRTYTYIDATKNTDKLIKRLRYLVAFLFIYLLPQNNTFEIRVRNWHLILILLF